jgi:hypothetical protein
MATGTNKPNELLDAVIRAEVLNLETIADLATRFVTDRVKQNPTDLTFEPATGNVLGALSAAALAAKSAIERKIIEMGGEPDQIP